MRVLIVEDDPALAGVLREGFAEHEIASVVEFVSSDRASYLAATTVFVDGGLMHSSPGL